MLTVYITKYELAWWLCFGIMSGGSRVQTLVNRT